MSDNQTTNTMTTVNDIKSYYDSVHPEYESAKAELEKAKDKFNKKYGELSRGAKPIVGEFTERLFKYLTERLDVRKSSYSDSLSEIYVVDAGIEKISFHNKFYVSAYQPDFTFMIRDDNLNSIEGELPMDKSPEEVGEILLKKFESFVNIYG